MRITSSETIYDALKDEIIFLKRKPGEEIDQDEISKRFDVSRSPVRDALMRLRFPDALIPATTALATLDGQGRVAAILGGANVVMPNLSPSGVREKYAIYDHKACQGGESAEGVRQLEQELRSIGYHIDYGRGDYV